MAETQHDLLYGLESKVLDKVRNDPVIMEKMSLLAQHQTGKENSISGWKCNYRIKVTHSKFVIW